MLKYQLYPTEDCSCLTVITSVVVPRGAIFTASASNPGASALSNVPRSCWCLEVPKPCPCGAVSLSGVTAERDGATRLSCCDFLHLLTP